LGNLWEHLIGCLAGEQTKKTLVFLLFSTHNNNKMSRFSAAGPGSNSAKDGPKTDPGKLLSAQGGEGFRRTGAVVTGKTGVDPGKNAPAAQGGDGFRRTGSTQNSTPSKSARDFQGVGEQTAETSKIKPIADDAPQE
jgi:hypothetical protein